MKIEFFETRTLARENVKVLNGKFKDFGSQAEKGKRWAVVTNSNSDIKQEQEIIDSVPNQTKENIKLHDKLIDSIFMPVLPGLVRHNDRVTPNGKPVHIMVRRSQIAVRLAKHLSESV